MGTSNHYHQTNFFIFFIYNVVIFAMDIVNVHTSYENFAHDINEREIRLIIAFASLFLDRDVNEDDIKIKAYDREPETITGKLEYQGEDFTEVFPMKIFVPRRRHHAQPP